ncbi:MAG: DNA-deoxyinosine glycosylase [Immundisolibacteraceae bacterium]|nr:DNA-deoxyinosine glycosylase [Immundisolibacteraceae bacterium]
MSEAKRSFAPLVGRQPRALILGTLPGEEALRKQQYYGNPRNAFWGIMAELFGFSVELDYEQRVTQLLRNPIAVWDVIDRCLRPGSLDSSIETESIQPNGLVDFLQSHPTITQLFFNGSRADQEFRRHILPLLGERLESLAMTRLPSTSPAMARLRPAEKLEQWRVVADAVLI